MKLLPFLTLVCVMFLSNCAPLQDIQQPKKVSMTESKQIERSKPKHIGYGESGSYGLYDYTVYKHSVSIKAPGVVLINFADVYDINKDGYYDSVFVFQEGAWRFASTLGPEYRLIPNSTSSSVLRDHIGLASVARNQINERRAREAERKRREQEEAFRQYQEGVRNGTIQPYYGNQ